MFKSLALIFTVLKFEILLYYTKIPLILQQWENALYDMFVAFQFCNCYSFCRMHAEFQINEPPNFPFWFSPAQFAGNIVISSDGKHVEDFTLYVPNDKKLNVGMLCIFFCFKKAQCWQLLINVMFI